MDIHAYDYTYTDSNGCKNSWHDSLELRKSSSAILSSVPSLCLNSGVYQLVGIPKGGVYSGKGVSSNLFDPKSEFLSL